MRLLSRVIKASNLVVMEPTEVRPNAYGIARLVEVTAGVSHGEPARTEETVVNLEQMQAEAERILQETEAMVQELIDSARQKATAILEEAKQAAEQLQLNAQADIEQAIKEGLDNGYQEGYEAGRQQGLADCEEMRVQAQQHLAAAEQERLEIVKASEQEIIDLALVIANKIVGYEVKANSDAIIGIIRSALQKVTDRQELIIKVSPTDLNKVIGLEEEIYREFQGIKKLRIVGDEFVQAGGCEIETACGSVDAQVETQLARIKEVLMGVM